MGRLIARRPVVRITPAGRRSRPDSIAVEEPLELRVDGKPLAVTMRTPGHDVELAHGFLHTEGVIGSVDDIRDARYCDSLDDEGRNTYNVLDIGLAPGVPAPVTGVERNFYTTSSCGVCGKASLDAVRTKTRHSPAADDVTIRYDVLAGLPDALRERQQVFDRTGGLHAAALFDENGNLLDVREDVGRHNGLDKLIGRQFLDAALPLHRRILLVSGRASFELLQKAVMAGIPVVAAIGAPSSLAVELAHRAHITLLGFVRQNQFNIYSAPWRIIP